MASKRIPTKSPYGPVERRELAELAGIVEPYLYQCLTNRRDLAPGRAHAIEIKTGGRLTRQMLCQATWREIWPELQT